MQEKYGINEMAVLVDLPVRTIRFYLQKGVISAPHGTGRGAWYDVEHLEQLLKIKRWQSAGLSLERIQELLKATDEPELPELRAKAGDLRVISHLYLGQGLTLMIDPSAAGVSSEQLRLLAQALMSTYEQVMQIASTDKNGGLEND
ncbi:MAG: MerR family transcriptional regulator [Shewanella fodinae]|nr:MerR family transcriptional regulator [Shewanella fodinae]